MGESTAPRKSPPLEGQKTTAIEHSGPMLNTSARHFALERALGAVLVADGAHDDEAHAVEIGGLREDALLLSRGRDELVARDDAALEDLNVRSDGGRGGRAPCTHICSDLACVRAGRRGTTSACSSTSATARSSATPKDRGGTRELRAKLLDYVHWYYNFKIHSTLGYMSPVEFREAGPSHPESSK